MDILTIFKATSLVKSIAQYLGIIESISGKLDKLAKSVCLN